MLGLGDDERQPNAHHARRLAEDDLDPARIFLVAGNLARALRRLDVVEPHDAPLGLRHGFLREDDDVAVLELEPGGNERGEVVPFTDLRQSLDCDDADFLQLIPVIRMPACAL